MIIQMMKRLNYGKRLQVFGDDRIIRIPLQIPLVYGRYWTLWSLLGDFSTMQTIFLAVPLALLDEDGDRFIEIWNLVFMQYEQLCQW